MNQTDAQRYLRQTMLPEFGSRGQKKLANASILIVGAGGLGSILALYLASAGIGRILIADNDTLEISNLNRQIIHDEASIGVNKALSASNRIGKLNSSITVVPIQERMTDQTITPLLKNIDLIADATDNYQTRQVINRACLAHDIPWVFGGVKGFGGMLSVFKPKLTPCFECIVKPPKLPDIRTSDNTVPNEEKLGVIGPAAGVIGSFQAMACMKLLLGLNSGLENKLLRISGLDMRIISVNLLKNPDCPACKIYQE